MGDPYYLNTCAGCRERTWRFTYEASTWECDRCLDLPSGDGLSLPSSEMYQASMAAHRVHDPGHLLSTPQQPGRSQSTATSAQPSSATAAHNTAAQANTFPTPQQTAQPHRAAVSRQAFLPSPIVGHGISSPGRPPHMFQQPAQSNNAAPSDRSFQSAMRGAEIFDARGNASLPNIAQLPLGFPPTSQQFAQMRTIMASGQPLPWSAAVAQSLANAQATPQVLQQPAQPQHTPASEPRFRMALMEWDGSQRFVIAERTANGLRVVEAPSSATVAANRVSELNSQHSLLNDSQRPSESQSTRGVAVPTAPAEGGQPEQGSLIESGRNMARNDSLRERLAVQETEMFGPARVRPDREGLAQMEGEEQASNFGQGERGMQDQSSSELQSGDDSLTRSEREAVQDMEGLGPVRDLLDRGGPVEQQSSAEGETDQLAQDQLQSQSQNQVRNDSLRSYEPAATRGTPQQERPDIEGRQQEQNRSENVEQDPYDWAERKNEGDGEETPRRKHSSLG